MPRFVGYLSNGQYSVGCTGQTVYVYDSQGTELTRFKDIKYAYTPLFFPQGDRFLVKSTAGQLAIYSLTDLNLIKKFRFSKTDGAQDDNMCFSPDGKLFYNVEGHPHPTEPGSSNFAIGIYETENFTLLRHLFKDDPIIQPHGLQYDRKSNLFFMLGSDRRYAAFHPFVAILENDQLRDRYDISAEEFDFYHGFIGTSGMGFTPLSKAWSPLKYHGYDLDQVQHEMHHLSDLWLLHAILANRE